MNIQDLINKLYDYINTNREIKVFITDPSGKSHPAQLAEWKEVNGKIVLEVKA